MSPTSRIGMAFLVVALLTIVPYTIFKNNGRDEYNKMLLEVEEMTAGNEKLMAQNRRLRRKLQALQTNPRLIERRAREHLQMARQDELILVFDDPPRVLQPSPPNDTQPPTLPSRDTSGPVLIGNSPGKTVIQ